MADNGFIETPYGLLPQGWNYVALGDIAINFIGGGTPRTGITEYWGGDIAWTTSAQISSDLYLGKGAKNITTKGLKNSSTNLVPKGNLLVGTRVGVGKVAINTIDMAISQDLTGIIIDKTKANPEFLAYAIRSPIIQERFTAGARGTTIKGIPREDVKLINIPFPPLPEQRAIAAALTVVQRDIESTETVIAAVRETKRAMMKHLFTFGPVSVAKAASVVCKDTEIGLLPKHWEIRKINEFARVQGGKRLPKGHAFSGTVTSFPYIRVVDFDNWSVNTTDIKYLTPSDRDRISRYIITIDDVYISIAGTIGLVGIIPEKLDSANLTENAARIIIHDKIRVNNYYLLAFLASSTGQSEIASRTIKTSQPKLALTRIKQIPVPLPPVVEQQQFIEMLKTINNKITSEEQRKAALEVTFSSLLHNLLTGRVRVTSKG